MKIPVRFKRVAAAFDEDVAKVRSWESSGSEHSADLSDLVNSFLEREIKSEEVVNQDEIDVNDDDELDSNSHDFESREQLKSLLFDLENDDVKGSIHAEVEKTNREIGSCDSSSLPDFKRLLMDRLRIRGFDAGFCKSNWEKNSRCPSGNYEYVDVNAGGARYIVQLNLAGEFTIARPNGGYASLLEILPPIFVGKPEELKQVVRLMCSAMRKSMRSVGIHVPPWRRLGYMQNKWFGAYKRTINEISSRKASNYGGGLSSVNQRVGFAPMEGISFYCRKEFAPMGDVRMGNLAAALN